MKLILCPDCNDITSLRSDQIKVCACGRSGGRYVDELNAEIWGRAIPLGFANSTVVTALERRPDAGQGSTFTAFVIPYVCSTVAVVDAPAESEHVGGRRFTRAQRDEMRAMLTETQPAMLAKMAEHVAATCKALLDDAERADAIILDLVTTIARRGG